MSELAKRLRAVDGDTPYLNHDGVARLCHDAADSLDAYERAWTATSPEAQLMEENRQLQSKLDKRTKALERIANAECGWEGEGLAQIAQEALSDE